MSFLRARRALGPALHSIRQPLSNVNGRVSNQTRRQISSAQSSNSSSGRGSRVLLTIAGGLGVLAGTVYLTAPEPLAADDKAVLPLASTSPDDLAQGDTALTRAPLSALIRTYVVYSFTSLPLIVDYSPAILNGLINSPIPGIGAISEYFIRGTFFDQFVGGDEVEDCAPVMEKLREENIGTMLVYSVEVEEHDNHEGDPAVSPVEIPQHMKLSLIHI